MTSFEDREKEFEKKYALDEELQFKATSRRNKLLGLWAAEKMGISGADAEAYAKALVMADVGKGDSEVMGRIRTDFAAKKVTQSDHQIERTMAELMMVAVEQVRAGR